MSWLRLALEGMWAVPETTQVHPGTADCDSEAVHSEGAMSGRHGEGGSLEGEGRHCQGRFQEQSQHRVVGAPGSGEWAGGLWTQSTGSEGSHWAMMVGVLPPPSTDSVLIPVGQAGLS